MQAYVTVAFEDAFALEPETFDGPRKLINPTEDDEIAHYVETHKHELPRSHEVCIRVQSVLFELHGVDKSVLFELHGVDKSVMFELHGLDKSVLFKLHGLDKSVLSPLLGQPLLVSLPPLVDMLKFSGYSYLIRGQPCVSYFSLKV
jgi:hypothetical protein